MKETILCSYGCGQPAIQQFKNGKWCCSNNQASCPKVKEKNNNLSFKKINNTEGIICHYGCGQIAEYKNGHGKYCCKSNYAKCPAVKNKISESSKGKFVSSETRYKLSQLRLGKPSPTKGMVRSKEAIEKTAESNRGQKRTKEQRGNISSGIKNSIEESIEKWGNRYKNGSPLKGRKLSKDHRKKLSKAKKGKPSPKKGIPGKKPTSETKLKMRLTHLKLIEDRLENGFQMTPYYNATACILIDQYSKENGYNFKHAENGGEYYIKDLGYWVDGYDAEKNTVIEIDEPSHYESDGNLMDRDVRRQTEIIDHLGCEFIRLKLDRDDKVTDITVVAR